jgi:hypothetical protein
MFLQSFAKGAAYKFFTRYDGIYLAQKIQGRHTLMGKTVLQQLYDGDIYPFEQIGSDNAELRKATLEVVNERANFLNRLPQEYHMQFHKLDEMQSENSALYGYESFTHGFKLAMALMFESLNGKGGTPIGGNMDKTAPH